MTNKFFVTAREAALSDFALFLNHQGGYEIEQDNAVCPHCQSHAAIVSTVTGKPVSICVKGCEIEAKVDDDDAGSENEQADIEYKIDDEKLAEVACIFNDGRVMKVTADAIKDIICDDWPQGQEHQDWIDKASAEEIADWLNAFYE